MLLGARHVPERLCGGYVYLGRYIKCLTFTFYLYILTCTFSLTNVMSLIATTSEDEADREPSSGATEPWGGGGEAVDWTSAGLSAIICRSFSPASWPLTSDLTRLCFRWWGVSRRWRPPDVRSETSDEKPTTWPFDRRLFSACYQTDTSPLTVFNIFKNTYYHNTPTRTRKPCCCKETTRSSMFLTTPMLWLLFTSAA